jgi:hypothetical protein
VLFIGIQFRHQRRDPGLQFGAVRAGMSKALDKRAFLAGMQSRLRA